jgi:hypothetical protein
MVKYKGAYLLPFHWLLYPSLLLAIVEAETFFLSQMGREMKVQEREEREGWPITL